ncbi:MAG TPA: hypothetical protein VLU99_07470 [Nitrososphaerales archaeon]|nr:hypothetical protein [Nitrososphaerales archaeon]
MTRVDDIEAAFYEVKSSAETALGGDEASKDRSFQDIFALNNAIGRLAREQPATMPKMKELQGYVNMITVGIKYERAAELREGLAVTEEMIKDVKRELSSQP